MVKSKGEVTYLRPEFNDAAKRHINDYLNAEFPDHGKVVLDLGVLVEKAERLVFSKYDGQEQVVAYFKSPVDNGTYAVTGLGQSVDLAILSCYVKCALVLLWRFVPVEDDDSPVQRPQFS